MATITFTFSGAAGEAGPGMRALARGLVQAADSLGMDRVAGPSVVLTVDNAPSTGLATMQITSGWPNAGSAPLIRV